MQFTTDKQTLEDLNIFGMPGENSIYNIFNRTVTRGGAEILEEMFRHPLSDENAINHRSNIIRHFASSRAVFPFQSALFDAAAPYLDNTDERSRLSKEEHSLGKKLSQLIAPDTEYQLIYKGVTALIDLIKGWYAFITANSTASGNPYQRELEAVAALLANDELTPLLKSNTNHKLSYATIAEYDGLLRFRHRRTAKELLRYTYHLDVYISIAIVAVERKFVFPTALSREQHTVILEDVYHPLLKNPVPNSLRITPDNNVIFLTGANMAGKSTFMKSLSIALFLAHMGLPVAAAKMEFSVLDGIYTTINLPDDLGMGVSHFYAEVVRVKKLAKELSQSKELFIVFDELFRGTNVKDAYEATVAITAAFAERKTSMFIISTHIVEAGEALGRQCDNIRFLYLPTRMAGNTPVYPYTLEEGVTDDRHGMIIINNEGILDILKRGSRIIKKIISS